MPCLAPRLALVLSVAFFAAQLAQAQSAVDLVQETGLRGGLIYLPAAAEPETALRLAAETPFIVFAQTANAATALALRSKAAELNLLARKLYVDYAPASHLPIAPRSATIVLADALSAAQASEENLQVWLEAVTPVRGVAIIPAQAFGALDALLKKRPELSVEKAVGGVKLCRRAALPGTDTWPQKFHDASNVRSSLDTTVDAPFFPAWYALPTNLGYWGDTMVTGGGRCYFIWANRVPVTSVSMLCFDLRNGAKLWEKPFTWDTPRDKNNGGYYPGRSCMAALGDDVWLIDEDSVRCLDGETGTSKTLLPSAKPGGQVKWLGEEQGILAVLAGDADTFSTSTLQQHVSNPFGSTLAAYEAKSGKRLWSETEAERIDERELAIRGGNLYYHVLNTRVVCRDLKTGTVLWEQKDPQVLALLAARREGDLHGLLVSLRVLAATEQALYFSSSLLMNRVALDIKNGNQLWSEPVGKSNDRALPDLLYQEFVCRPSPQKAWPRGKFVLSTNERVADFNLPNSGCGPSWSGPNYLVSPFGGVHKVDGTMLRDPDLKSACEVGTVISDGVGFNAAGICRCAMEIQGFRGFTWNEPQIGTAPLEALGSGPALGAKAGSAATAMDWAAYRGNNRRSGSSAALVATQAPSVAWTWEPPVRNRVITRPDVYGVRYLEEPEFLPSQVLSVGRTAYFSDHQGVVRALSQDNGKELWRYPVGAHILTAPAYAQGRLVVGDMDGFVTCLEARTGELAWRYRVPPTERRIMWYGHLASSWPLVGGVLIQDDTVFCAAGFQSDYGVYAAALNLFSGKPVWTKYIAPAKNPEASIGVTGALTLAGGKVFFPTGTMVPAALDIKTGQEAILPPVRFAGTDRRGKDIAALSDDWLVYGGARPYRDFNRWLGEERLQGYSLCKTNLSLTANQTVCLGADFSEPSMLLPVFDEELLIAGCEYPQGNRPAVLQAWNRQGILKKAAAFEVGGGGQRGLLKKDAPYSFNTLVMPNEPLPPEGLWQDITIPVYAAALCKNAVVVLHPAGADKKNQSQWAVSALDRLSGKTMWTCALPERPAWDGLSVAADGSLLIALWDGRVLGLR